MLKSSALLILRAFEGSSHYPYYVRAYNRDVYNSEELTDLKLGQKEQIETAPSEMLEGFHYVIMLSKDIGEQYQNSDVID